MLSLGSLLSRGYFLRELPPAFTTDRFANTIMNNLATLPAELGPASTKSALLQAHSVARHGISRRNMFLPNPIPYLRLCREIANKFQIIEVHCRNSTISRSIPTVNPGTGRALVPLSNFQDLDVLRSRLRSTSKYVLKADIAKFYPSLYTHSVPWALHGKPFAKSNQRNLSLLGNLLDFCLRNCQDKQTIGVPIGPDTSLVISEIVLSAADAELSSRFSNLNGLRYADDLEFGLKTYSEAEKLLAHLQEVLKAFELDLNFDKTRIVELPLPLDPQWVTELRTFQIRRSPKTQRNDLIHYYSRAFELSGEFSDEFVLRYAVARLRGVRIHAFNWDIVQDFLFQCVMVEPGTFLFVLERLMDAHQDGLKIDHSRLQEVMNFQIIQHSPAGHGSEVAWALWAVIFWSLTLSKEAADAVSKMEDSVVALLALDAEQRRLVPSGLSRLLWQSFMTQQDLYDRQWLLAYEANVKGWLASSTGHDHVSSDPAFGFLKASGVEFYDSRRLFTYWPRPTSGAGIRSAQFSMITLRESG